MDLPESTNSKKSKKKYNNVVWWLVIFIVLGPSFFLAWGVVSQPPGNEIFYGLERPNEGVGFDIRKAEIMDGEMELQVSYFGGCSDHKFDLYVEEQQSDINREVSIYHSTDENCETKVFEDISFDIQSVIDEHDSEQVVFTIIGNGREPEPVLVKKPKTAN